MFRKQLKAEKLRLASEKLSDDEIKMVFMFTWRVTEDLSVLWGMSRMKMEGCV